MTSPRRTRRRRQAGSGGALPKWLLVVNAALVALIISVLLLTLFLLPSPTPDQRDTLRLLTSILFGALGACLTGTAMLKVSMTLGKGAKVAISATAGLALLLIAYLIPPYWNPPAPTKDDCRPTPTQPSPIQRGC